MQAEQIFNGSLHRVVDDILLERSQMPASYEVLTLETNDYIWSSTLLLHHYSTNAKRLTADIRSYKIFPRESTDRLSLTLAERKEGNILG